MHIKEEIIFDSCSNINKYIEDCSTICIVSGSSVQELKIASTIYNSLKQSGVERLNSISIPDGDLSKNQDIVNLLIDSFLKFRLDRNSIVISVGGGSISDVAGYVCSIFLRGINFYSVPTTLLAMIDASVGGKRAINYKGIKNIIGTFYFAKKILIDKSILSSLPISELQNGLVELAKTTFISDNSLLQIIRQHKNLLLHDGVYDIDILIMLVKKAICAKQKIVASDMYDKKGIRSILNYGHTLAHAIESSSNYKIPHGISVAIGMDFAAFLSHELKICRGDILKFQEDVYEILGFYELYLKVKQIVKNYEVDDLIRLMAHDKKVSKQKINFIVLKDLSNVKYLKLDTFELKMYLSEYFEKI